MPGVPAEEPTVVRWRIPEAADEAGAAAGATTAAVAEHP